MNTKKDMLAKQLTELDKHLEVKKLKWNMGIFLGYSIGVFILFLIGIESIFDNITYILGFLLVSLFLGGVCYWLNALVWITCCNSINETKNLKNKLEKKWEELIKEEQISDDVQSAKTQIIPGKYLKRGYNEFQIEYIKEAFQKYGLTEADIDYFLSLKDEPELLMEYHYELKYEMEIYMEEVGRQKAAEEVFKTHGVTVKD